LDIYFFPVGYVDVPPNDIYIDFFYEKQKWTVVVMTSISVSRVLASLFFIFTVMGEKSFRGVMFAVKTESLHHDSYLYRLNYDTSMDKLYIFPYV